MCIKSFTSKRIFDYLFSIFYNSQLSCFALHFYLKEFTMYVRMAVRPSQHLFYHTLALSLSSISTTNTAIVCTFQQCYKDIPFRQGQIDRWSKKEGVKQMHHREFP